MRIISYLHFIGCLLLMVSTQSAFAQPNEIITTKSGRTYGGVAVDLKANGLVLKSSNGREVVIPNADFSEEAAEKYLSRIEDNGLLNADGTFVPLADAVTEFLSGVEGSQLRNGVTINRKTFEVMPFWSRVHLMSKRKSAPDQRKAALIEIVERTPSLFGANGTSPSYARESTSQSSGEAKVYRTRGLGKLIGGVLVLVFGVFAAIVKLCWRFIFPTTTKA